MRQVRRNDSEDVPACGAGDGIKPGVERSATPGPWFMKFRAREAGDRL
jgi:hypothetical protein